MGLSFYETFIKPLLKIKDKYIENNQIELVESLTEWKNAEPNLNNTILTNIEQTINGEIPETNKWNKDVQKQAFTRLFHNNIIPEIKEKISSLKMPQIINILSNASTPIIEGIIKYNSN